MLLASMFRNPLIFWLPTLMDAVEIPDLNEASAEARQQTQQSLHQVIQGLKAGRNHILWPSGRVYRSGGHESLGAEVLRHDVPSGKGAALHTGWRQALERGFKWTLTLDGDGQHSPEDIPRFFECADRTAAELVSGNRMTDPKIMPWNRRFVNRWMSKRISKFTGREMPDTQCGFRLMNLKAWAAVPKTDVAKGAEVTIEGPMPMQGFESKTLNRKFDTVYFGTLGDAPAQPVAMGGPGAPGEPPSPANMAAQHAAASTAPVPAEVGDVKVAKATGSDARTVAEIFAQRTALKEKPVTVRGKVVKSNEGIMGRNWLHVRDGSGTAGKDNDITITTNDKAAVGDVVLVKGTVRTDKDFGAGYAYPVIVEDAKVSK